MNTQDTFWARTRQFEDGCIEWQGTRNGNGYGYFSLNGKVQAVHRLAWEFANGAVPAGLVVRHECDNPPCVNLEHLSVGTQTDNMGDWKLRGRPARREIRPASPLAGSRGFIGPCLTRGDFIVG
jgi:hypothetical protein